MTEAEFQSQRKTIDGIMQKARAKRAEAARDEQFAQEWLMDLLKVADQEPWWGEAND